MAREIDESCRFCSMFMVPFASLKGIFKIGSQVLMGLPLTIPELIFGLNLKTFSLVFISFLFPEIGSEL